MHSCVIFGLEKPKTARHRKVTEQNSYALRNHSASTLQEPSLTGHPKAKQREVTRCVLASGGEGSTVIHRKKNDLLYKDATYMYACATASERVNSLVIGNGS